jgi:hypothetical protein
MQNPDLGRKAACCRRLARIVSDPDAARALDELAGDSERVAFDSRERRAAFDVTQKAVTPFDGKSSRSKDKKR